MSRSYYSYNYLTPKIDYNRFNAISSCGCCSFMGFYLFLQLKSFFPGCLCTSLGKGECGPSKLYFQDCLAKSLPTLACVLLPNFKFLHPHNSTRPTFLYRPSLKILSYCAKCFPILFAGVDGAA